MQSTRIVIEELKVPASTDDPAFTDYRDAVAIGNAVAADTIPGYPFLRTAEESLPGFQDQKWHPGRQFVARVDGELVGRGYYEWPAEPDTSIAYISVEVLPGHRRQGIGTAMSDHLESLAIAQGRTTYQAWVPHRTMPGGERLPSPSGFEDLPADEPTVRFLLGRGYRLEQVQRMSTLDLPVPDDTLRRYREFAEATSTEYRTISWVGTTPDDRLDDMCWLRNRMSVDMPAGAMAVVEETWTLERIRGEEDRHVKSGFTSLTATAEHVPTGKLAGYTILLVPTDRSQPVWQDATLVASDHRGHRLGMRLKVANIELLYQFSPGSTLIATGNAEENRYMLATNEAVGFRALYAEGAWEKRVGD